MHYLLFRATMTIDLTYSEILRDVPRWCDARELLHNNTIWQMKVVKNSNLVTKIKKWTDINASMHRKYIIIKKVRYNDIPSSQEEKLNPRKPASQPHNFYGSGLQFSIYTGTPGMHKMGM